MAERWQRELKKLRHAEPRVDLWARVEEGPHGSPPAIPGRQRLLAAGVAFAVFIAAGLFAWNVMRPARTVVVGDVPIAARGPGDLVVTLRAPTQPSTEADLHLPTAVFRLGDAETNIPTQGMTGWPDIPVAGFNQPLYSLDFTVPAGTRLAIDGDATSASARVRNGMPIQSPTQELDLSNGSAILPSNPGQYVIDLTGDWAEGTATFTASFEIVASDAPTPQASTSLERESIVVSYPSGWTLASEILTPHLADPREIFALGTYPLRPGGTSCAQYPVNAIEDLGPSDALIWFAERKQVSADVSTRPNDFQTWTAASTADDSEGCLSDPKDFVHHYGEFSDAGRVFDLYVAYGASISPATSSELWGILDGMIINASNGG